METRFYKTETIDLPGIADTVVEAYQAKGFEIHRANYPDEPITELRHRQIVGAVPGLNTAIDVRLRRRQGGTLVEVAVRDWVESLSPWSAGEYLNAAIHPVTMSMGVHGQHRLAEEVLALLDELIHQQQPSVHVRVPAPALPVTA